MASFVYNYAKRRMGGGGGTSWDFTADTIRVTLCYAGTSAGSATTAGQDATTIGDINTLNEFDGAAFTAADRTVLATKTVSQDNTNERVELDAANITWTSQTAGSGNIVGALIYRVSGTFSQSNPLAWVSFPSAITPNGGDITVSWSSNGIIQLTD